MGRPCSDTSPITAKQSTSYFSNFRAAEQDAHVELVDPLPRVLQLLLADLANPLGVLCGGELQMNGMHALKSGEELCEGY